MFRHHDPPAQKREANTLGKIACDSMDGVPDEFFSD